MPEDIHLSGAPNLDNLPLELLQEISLYLEQHDIGSLRLASSTCSKIAIQYMLQTLPFRLTFDGVARLLAISDFQPFSQRVHKLIFTCDCPGPLHASLELERLRRMSNARLTLKELALRYTTESFGGDFGEPRLEMPYGFSDVQGPEVSCWCLGSYLHKTMVLRTMITCCERFRNLEEVCMSENGYLYGWTTAGDWSMTSGGREFLGYAERPQLAKMLLPLFDIHSLRFNLNVASITDNGPLPTFLDILTTCGLDKRKRVSLKISNDATVGRRSIATLTNFQELVLIRTVYRFQNFLYHECDLDEVEIKLPYHSDPDKSDCLRHSRALVTLSNPPYHNFLASQGRLRKLDLGYFVIEDEELIAMLEEYREALRELQLTRVDLSRGSWAAWFREIRFKLDHLEHAEFHGWFGECDGKIFTDMDAIMESSDGSAPRALGSQLGEICLARTPLDSALRKQVLGFLD